MVKRISIILNILLILGCVFFGVSYGVVKTQKADAIKVAEKAVDLADRSLQDALTLLQLLDAAKQDTNTALQQRDDAIQLLDQVNKAYEALVNSYRTTERLLNDEDFLLCEKFRQTFPQSAQEVANKYNVDISRVEMAGYNKCTGPNFAYWAFVLWDGPSVTIEVPDGGFIMVYASDTMAPGTYYAGTVSGTRLFVAAYANANGWIK